MEYAKAAPDDILMRVTVHNRGPEAAAIHLAAATLFSQHLVMEPFGQTQPVPHEGVHNSRPAPPDWAIMRSPATASRSCFSAKRNQWRSLFGLSQAAGFFKDAFHEYIVRGNRSAVNPGAEGTKAGALYQLTVPAGRSAQVRLRLARQASGLSPVSGPPVGAHPSQSRKPAGSPSHFADFDAVFAQRLREADEFYAELQRDITDADARLVQRQAFAGMIWSKQFYHYDVPQWLRGDPAQPPPPPERKHGRNAGLEAPEQRRHHFHAGQMGVSVVSPRGTWRFIACRWRWWTRSLPSISSSC